MVIKKFIFYLLLFFSPLCFATQTSDISFFTQLASYLSNSAQKTQNPDTHSVFVLLPDFLNMNAKKIPLWNDKTGIGEWIQFDGGKARLISATTGFINLKEATVALQFHPEKDALIRNIKIFLPQNSTDTLSFVQLPVLKDTFQVYQENFLIPIRLHVPLQPIPWHIQINASFDVCRQNICTPKTIAVPFLLDAEKAYPTEMQSFILDNMKHIPQVLPDKYPVSSYLKNDRLFIRATLPYDIKTIKVLLPDSSLAYIENIFIVKKNVFFDFTVPDFLRARPVLPLILLTDRGYFYQQINLMQQEKFSNQTLPLTKILLACLSGLFFCPFLFLCLYHGENKTATIKRNSLRIIKGIIFFFFCLMICWILGIQHIFNLSATSVLFAVIGMFSVWLLLENFHHPSFYFVMLIWFFMPKGFWQILFNQNFSVLYIILICCFEMMLFLGLPLWVFFKATTLKKIHKYMIPLMPIFKLPFYMLIVVTGLSLAGNFYINQHIPEYNFLAATTALKQNKTVVLFVEHPITITGFADKWWALTTGAMNTPALQKQIQAFRVPVFSAFAKRFAHHHHLPAQLPVVIIYNHTYPKGKILLNNGDYLYLSQQLAASIP